MTRALTLGIILTAVLQAQTAGPPDDPNTRYIRSVERTLTAVLKWEILWNDSPKGFRLPGDGSIALAIHAASGSVSYCSHQAGVCVTYRTEDDRNWEGTGQAPCDDNRSDVDAVLAFIGKEPPATGTRSFSGIPAAGSGVAWATKITLGSRAEIVSKYQQMHPPGMSSLQDWIHTQGSLSGVESITIACFAPTDPMVYYYVERPITGPPERPTAAPTIMAVFWRLDRPEEWVVAGYSQQWQNPQRFDEMRRTIESISCSTLRFK